MKNLFRILIMALFLGNILTLAYAADTPNFDKLRSSDEILETTQEKTLGLWEYFVWFIELIFAGTFLWALASYNLTKDEAKAASYKSWLIRSIIATIICGFYLAYLYA